MNLDPATPAAFANGPRLPAGTRLGAYDVEALIGAGGMGEVYRATDPRLDRQVAIKVLPLQTTADPDARRRFEHEARAISRLNHPNICTLHDVGHETKDSTEIDFVVMELVSGKTLAELVSSGPLPSQAFNLARQIATALEYAHEHGVIHRDLKPGNIKVTVDGHVKLLDFGLATALRADEHNGADAVISEATRTGAILGTPAYMAPEQAQGGSTDRRVDIWAFGVVLFEMLTGARAFARGNVAETLTAVMTAPPDWARLPTTTPPAIRRLLERCLDKDPKRRLRDIGEARIALESPDDAVVAPPTGQSRQTSIWKSLGWAVAALAVVALIAVLWTRGRPADATVLRSTILPPANVAFDFSDDYQFGPPALSPDGQRLVYSAKGSDGRIRLWLRSLQLATTQDVSGTDGGMYPFWSADSHWIAFFADGKLKKIPASGGDAVAIADGITNGRGGSWNRDDVILFAPGYFTQIFRVSAAGGAVTPATTLDASRTERTNRFPWFLPDNRHFLYTAQDVRTSYSRSTVRLGSLDSRETRVLFDADSNVIYSQGYLLYLLGGALVAQPFDASRLATTGDPQTIVEGVLDVKITACGVFSAAANGLLVYETGTPEADQLSLMWWDRSGRELATVGKVGPAQSVRLSGDDRRAVVSVRSPSNRGTDLWIYDLTNGSRTRFTITDGFKRAGVWSPGNETIIFPAPRNGTTGPQDIFQKPADGGPEESLYSDATDKSPTSISPDGKSLLFVTPPSGTYGTFGDLWVLADPFDRTAMHRPIPFMQTPFVESWAMFSPDGHWVTYQSDEGQQGNEIYVAPFPGPGGKRPVSRGGGTYPRWRADGKEIVYIAPDSHLVAADVTATATTFEVGAIHELPLVAYNTGVWSTFDVARDGRLLLLIPPAQHSSEPLTLMQNWTAALKKN